ncbi:MAG: AzlC family ABC transporter permease [Firmicutes bacterium]|nr:AzlC family ABC transporter permease [Bacillota bacterium]
MNTTKILLDPSGATTQEFWSGIRDSLPVIVGIVPFGLACGILGITVGMTPLETILMSVLVFAGASQLVAITMLGAGTAGWGMVVLTTLLINLRHLLMGASLAPYMTRVPLPLQAVLAFGIVDESYALTMDRIRQKYYHPGYQFGCNLAFYIAWVTSTVAGAYLGKYIADPLTWGLDFAMPAMFLALLMPRLVDRTSATVCALAAAVAVTAALYLPGKWHIIIACLAASIAGGLLEGKKSAAQ